jgi:hypothetical protein
LSGKDIIEISMRNNILVAESDQTQFHKHKSLLKGKEFSYQGILRLTTVLLSYLLAGIFGLVGSILIIIKVINLPSISDFSMVLLFGVACISLAVMHAGFHGFYKVIRENK